jgi:molecular chaperone GrpE
MANEENAKPEAEQPEAEQAQGAPPESELASGAKPASAEDLTLLLEDARNKADEHWNQLLRTRAEMENMRRRMQRDVEQAHRYGLEKFVAELLPVKDSLERGLEAAGEAQDVAALRAGTELTLKMFQSAMEKFGVKEVNPLGEPFNPELHEAMTMQERSDVEPGAVAMVVQKGYTLNDRLIRAAMVIVARAPEVASDRPQA